MSDDDLLDFGAQGLEGGDERLNPGILTHRALLSRNPWSHSLEPFYREPSSDGVAALSHDHVSVILLDD
jgi:hypothetical protein